MNGFEPWNPTNTTYYPLGSRRTAGAQSFRSRANRVHGAVRTVRAHLPHRLRATLRPIELGTSRGGFCCRPG